METMVITVNLSIFTNPHSKLGFLVLNHLAEAFSDLSILLKSLPKQSPHPEPRHLQAKEKVDNIHSLGKSCGVPSGSGTISWFAHLDELWIAMENLIFPRKYHYIAIYILQYVCSNENSVDLSFPTFNFYSMNLAKQYSCWLHLVHYWHPSAQYKPIYTGIKALPIPPNTWLSNDMVSSVWGGKST